MLGFGNQIYIVKLKSNVGYVALHSCTYGWGRPKYRTLCVTDSPPPNGTTLKNIYLVFDTLNTNTYTRCQYPYESK